jgi:multidrug efflux pump
LLSIAFIYAILSIQFENFIDPFIILFTVPLASFGALLCTYIFGQSLNIYTQVGLITLIGLISKHGILIVEFANQLRQKGTGLANAIQTAAVLRLRPVLMTTGAMVCGAIPLVLSHDAGSEARRAIGTVLIGGLCWGTLFTLFVLPAVYYIIKLKSQPLKVSV